MPRKRRKLISNRVYECCIRTWDTLPMGSQFVSKLIIKSAIARTQRDDKVELCHDIHNGSHSHLFFVVKDAKQCTNFIGELEKRITDYFKRLLQIDHLNLWENRATLALIDDLESAVERISYFYANPGQDNLVDRIELFPGLSSWNAFKDNARELRTEVRETVPWIRMPSIPAVPSPSLTPHEDIQLCQELRDSNKLKHDLIRKPNIWMCYFGVTDDAEVAEVNERIFRRVREREAEAREKRRQTGKPLMGAAALRRQPLLKYRKRRKDKGPSKKIYFICSTRKRYKQLMKSFRSFCRRCTECYQAWRRGDFTVDWPPGAFKPPPPPLYNAFEPVTVFDAFATEQ